ncbi:MAG: hypothetical protein CVU84_05450 [Firmicutes bacterium HGW-Firmicutes-1]|jgi:hypothetical protein|nr:MAG: hypothetical protein CVU84_05450 [Firmicutes bacterium HGW-Firmicutes-1]
MKDQTPKILNALRMGVIPDTVLDELIVGRTQELEELTYLLEGIKNDGFSAVKFIKGEYGTGKSFMLNYLKQKALSEGFVVASLSITGGFNFSKFDGLYTAIMSNLEIKSDHLSKGTSFEEIFESWLKNIKKEKEINSATKDIYGVIATLNDYNNAFAMVLLTYIRAKINNDYELSNIAASWIKGDKNVSYELKKRLNVKGSVDIENAINVFRGFISLLTLIGYTGIMVFVDELEMVMGNRSDTRLKTYANIRYIMDACGTGELEKCGFVFAGTKELFMNEEKGFKSYDALNQRIGSTITGGKVQIANLRQPVIELKAFEQEDYFKITEKIMAIHGSHYHYRAPVDVTTIYNLVMIECSKTDKQGTTVRNYSKKLLEILDLIEQNPDLPIFKTKVSGIIRH